MIIFYHPAKEYGCFANFSRHPVTIYGYRGATSEHSFQAMKFHPHREDLVKAVFETKSPHDAAKMGRDQSLPIRKDWDLIAVDNPYPNLSVNDSRGDDLVIQRTKDLIMWQVCWAKIEQHQDIKNILLSTGDLPIIEDTSDDYYWGWGTNHTGNNKLGKILMGIRSVLSNSI